ncbi:26S proteasome non-ATPase regulatory subunit 9, partial [Dissophora globulifera]
MVSTQSDAMTRAQALMRQKDDIEAEIKKSQDELQSQKVGMTDRLVDSSGFPRADIDLVVVTTARSNIIKLKNDHKDIMVQIEEALHAVHAEALAEKQREQERKRQEAASSSSSSSSSAADLSTTQNKDDERGLAPFARVNAVAPDSPAQDAGLLQHDRIVSFGIVNINTDNVLPSLSTH